MVRLEGLEEVSDQFVRVRRTRIEDADLGLFEFDLDLTFMVFFLDAAERIYGRYGGRDAEGPDTRQSMAGLRHAMRQALQAHHRSGPIAPRRQAAVRITSSHQRGCLHCHEVKERHYDRLRDAGQWSRELLWRYPLPDNLGLVLRVNRGDTVERVQPDSAADHLGLRPGDVIEQLGDIPIHSLADAQYALDGAPPSGALPIAWSRAGHLHSGQLQLTAGWRRSDITWRPSMRRMIPSARVYGRDLTAQEREAHGLTARQLAFWQGYPVSSVAKAAGIVEGDIILGFDHKTLELEAYDFLGYVRRNYLVGDRVVINLIRDNRRLTLPMTLR